ncbi:hypothetical protein HPB49_011584 [Dermacentor silvarum]|uniref:Uncharacterized protein n=1 Tax=Dermacentor silvarum TaxID=543639 RepID=A0ACB8DZS4_DERSI|nr:hypothetical protein HPB49_011584 [Dermacentor silvarum]
MICRPRRALLWGGGESVCVRSCEDEAVRMDTALLGDIRSLERLECLKELIASFEVGFDHDIFRQLYISCPHIELLHFNSYLISRKDSWESLKHLRRLVSLFIELAHQLAVMFLTEHASTWKHALPAKQNQHHRFRKLEFISVYNNCGTGWFDARFTPREIPNFKVPRLHMQGFRKLEFISVYNNCGTGWFDARFTPREIPNFKVPRLHMQGFRKLEFISVYNNCGTGWFDARFTPREIPNFKVPRLHMQGFRKLEFISVYNNCGTGWFDARFTPREIPNFKVPRLHMQGFRKLEFISVYNNCGTGWFDARFTPREIPNFKVPRLHMQGFRKLEFISVYNNCGTGWFDARFTPREIPNFKVPRLHMQAFISSFMVVCHGHAEQIFVQRVFALVDVDLFVSCARRNLWIVKGCIPNRIHFPFIV